MSLTDELYKEIILDHYQSPRNFGKIVNAHVHEAGANPLCGDEIEIFLNIEGGIVKEIKFQGVGCSISQSSASMMCEAIERKKVSEILKLIANFKNILLNNEKEFDLEEEFDELESLTAVKKLPVRIKCAILSWNLLERSLKDVK